VLILEVEGIPAGFALFFHHYSTFLCRYGLYIEDIYVQEQYRGHGYGKKLFVALPKNATAEGLNGGVWTGTNPPSIFIKNSALNLWLIGQCIG
jgi:GNAT superfamily N-acetyltransferase